MTVSRDGEIPLRRSPARALAALRVGALAAVGIGRRSPSDQDAVRPLIAAHRRVFPGADADLLRRAYAVADHWHAGQTRKSGAPYVTHPLAVAILLAEIGMDTTTLVAALLHDTVEDTGLTIGEVKAEFGAEVAVLVDGVTKLDGSRWGDHAEAETFKQDDRRRLHRPAGPRHQAGRPGAQPADPRRPSPSGRSASGSPAPRWSCSFRSRQRLGLYDYQREMEDLSFANLAPEAYERVRALVLETSAARDAFLAGVVAGAREELAAVGLRAKVEVRARHLYSIHRGPARRRAAAGPTDTPGSSWWWTGPRPTATSRSAPCTAGGARSSSGSATTSACRSTTCTARCTPPCWSAAATARAVTWSACSSAPRPWTGSPATGWRRGFARPAARTARSPPTWPARPTWTGSTGCSPGSRWPRRPTSSTGSGPT